MSDFRDRLGPDMSTMLELKGQVNWKDHPQNLAVKNLKILRNEPETKTYISSTTTYFIQTRQKHWSLSS